MAVRMGLREANQSFSKAMKAVRAGKEVILTERGKAIAVIQPLQQGADPEAAVERLRVSGILRAAPQPGPMPAWKPRPLRGVSLASTVQKARDER